MATLTFTRDTSKDISDKTYISTITHDDVTYTLKDAEARQALSGKQDTLVSGTNIKTINGSSILGSGNVSVGTVMSVNNVSPVNGNVTISIPDVEEYTAAEVETLWGSI